MATVSTTFANFYSGTDASSKLSSYPSASALSGCNCLREASGSGLAYQLKLQAERQVGEKTYLFAQIGRVWLPRVTTTQGIQQTGYGCWGVNNLMAGVRWAFDRQNKQ